MKVSGATRVYGVIGDPVDHSLSPFIMNRAFARHGIDAVYAAFRVGVERVGEAVKGLGAVGVAGVNVTFPLKERVLEFVDSMTPAARAIGAANSLRFADGRIEADNTDAPGSAAALERIADVSLEGTRVFIFGAGGSARAAAYGLLSAGAGEVTFGVRDVGKTRGAVERLRAALPGRRIETHALRGDGAGERLAGVDIVVNATPVGMSGESSEPLVGGGPAIRQGQCWFDFVYHPRDTAFLRAARDGGATTVDGLALLVAQAQASFRSWTGVDFSLRDMFEAVVARAAAVDDARRS